MKSLVAVLVTLLLPCVSWATPDFHILNATGDPIHGVLAPGDTTATSTYGDRYTYAGVGNYPDTTAIFGFEIYISCSPGVAPYPYIPGSFPWTNSFVSYNSDTRRTTYKLSRDLYGYGFNPAEYPGLWGFYNVIRTANATVGQTDTIQLLHVNLLDKNLNQYAAIHAVDGGPHTLALYTQVSERHNTVECVGPSEAVSPGSTFDVWIHAADNLVTPNTGTAWVGARVKFDSTQVQTATLDQSDASVPFHNYVGCLFDGTCGPIHCHDVFFLAVNYGSDSLAVAGGHHCWGEWMNASAGPLLRVHLKLRNTVQPGTQTVIRFYPYAVDSWTGAATNITTLNGNVTVWAYDPNAGGGGGSGGGDGEYQHSINRALALSRGIEWYDVAGRKLDKRPTGKGVYFVRLIGRPESKRVVVL